MTLVYSHEISEASRILDTCFDYKLRQEQENVKRLIHHIESTLDSVLKNFLYDPKSAVQSDILDLSSIRPVGDPISVPDIFKEPKLPNRTLKLAPSKRDWSKMPSYEEWIKPFLDSAKPVETKNPCVDVLEEYTFSLSKNNKEYKCSSVKIPQTIPEKSVFVETDNEGNLWIQPLPPFKYITLKAPGFTKDRMEEIFLEALYPTDEPKPAWKGAKPTENDKLPVLYNPEKSNETETIEHTIKNG